jgi:maltoporin
MERRFFPPYGQSCLPVAAALLLTGSFSLAQNNSQAQNGASQDNEVSALKAQIQSMQKQQQQYQDRITSMEAEMQSLESKAESGSILNTRVLTDANGVATEGSPATLDESFLKSLTRNFTFSVYVRVGFQFNGNGGGGNFSFELPNFPGEGRERLGNENDTYMELTWMQAHMLGDSPDVMDVSMTFTPAIRYVQNRNTFDAQNNVTRSGNDFDFILRQAYLEAKNVFKTAPEVTFWAGVRFYDRWNTDPEDYFWLDTSGYGAGVYNIDLGVGKLWAAWIGGLNAEDISPGIGSYFKQTFDVRLKDIQLGPIPGSLALVLIGNYEKGGTFTQDYDPSGDIVDLTNPLHTDSAWGIGGGAIYTLHFGPGGANNSLTAYALFGRGITNFNSGADLSSVQGAENLFLFRHPGFTGQINVGDALNHGYTYRAGFQLYLALPWYHSEPASLAGTSKDGKAVAAPAPAAPALPWFSVGLFGDWEESYSGFAFGGTTGPGLGQGGNVVNPNEGIVSKVVSGRVHDFQFGARPAFWLADNIALQGQFSGQYESNNNIPGFPGFGKSGWLGVFDVGPVIKPKGGYYTKPEIRFFATYAVWSDSLKGMATPIEEGSGGGGGFAAPYNGNTNHGWLFGTQVEWFF